MRYRRLFPLFRCIANYGCIPLLLLLLGAAWLLGATGQAGAALSAPLALASDQFGYQADDTVAYSWLQADSTFSVTLQTDDRDNETSLPISLGFNFPFYENAYPQVYASTNGLIAFSLPGARSFVNSSIPLEVYPNNFVTPFWDDLALGGGGIYTGTGVTGGQRYFLIEWREVVFAGSPGDILTFEVILYENGNILFQYQTLNGALDGATVGIENADGSDGLLYAYNSAALAQGDAILITRPTGGRVKVSPVFQSDFIRAGEAGFDFQVTNIGDAGADTYDLFQVEVSQPGWQVEVSLLAGLPLEDTDGDSLLDTGEIAQGAAESLYVKIIAPANAQVGDGARATLTFQSSRNPTRQAVVTLEVVIPAPFAYAYGDTRVVQLGMVSRHHHYDVRVESNYTGNNLDLIRTAQGNYLYVWEEYGSRQVDNKHISFANIRYATYDRYGKVLAPSAILINNQAVMETTRDLAPVMAALPDGRVGILWARSVEESLTVTLFDMYFGLLGADGQPIGNPVNWKITQDSSAFTRIKQVRLAVTSDSKFVLSWVAYRMTAEGQARDIYLAVYDANRNKLFPTSAEVGFQFTNSQPQQFHYEYPSLAAVGQGKAWLAYTEFDLVNLTGANTLVVIDIAALLANPGDPQAAIGAPAAISDGGFGTVMTQLNNEHVLVAWKDSNRYQITYRLFDASTAASPTAATSLDLPSGHQADYVSVTSDVLGRGILTWLDYFNFQLVYALVGPDGALITPPTFFNTNRDVYFFTSYNGQGNAPFDDFWQVQMPLIQR